MLLFLYKDRFGDFLFKGTQGAINKKPVNTWDIVPPTPYKHHIVHRKVKLNFIFSASKQTKQKRDIIGMSSGHFVYEANAILLAAKM
jgi:hypothetical protein